MRQNIILKMMNRKIYKKKKKLTKLTGFHSSLFRSQLKTQHINMCAMSKKKREGKKCTTKGKR